MGFRISACPKSEIPHPKLNTGLMDKLFDLMGKVALITGSSSGMGKAIAEAMGSHGAKVVVSSFDTEGVIKTIEGFKKQGIATIGVPCDMSKVEDIDNLFQTAISTFGKIDILVNCVGMAIPNGFLDINAADFEKTKALNLQSTIYLTKLVIPQMVEQKDGTIIYLASIAGVGGIKVLDYMAFQKLD